jgi:hypothetical protein
MAILGTSANFDEGIQSYFQSIVTTFYIPTVATITGLFCLLGFVVFHKRVKEANHTFPWNLGRPLTSLNLVLIMVVALFFNTDLYFRNLENSAADIMLFRDSIVNELGSLDESFQLLLNADNSNCSYCGIITDGIEVISTFKGKLETIPTPTQLEDLKLVYKNVSQLVSKIFMANYLILAIAIVLNLAGLYVNRSFKIKHARMFHCITLMYSFILIVIGIGFFSGGVVLSDICQNTSSFLDTIVKSPDLQFYLTCNSTAANNYPDVIKTHPFINQFGTYEPSYIKVGCAKENVFQKIAAFETSTLFYFKNESHFSHANTTCCKCNSSLVGPLTTSLGNYTLETGLWSYIGCRKPHEILSNLEEAVCLLFEPMFSHFLLYINLAFHLTLAFFYLY